MVVDTLTNLGFKITLPQGAYYLLADFSDLPFGDDEEAAQIILDKAKVAVVPGRSFYLDPEKGKKTLRFCFALHGDKIQQAMQQLKTIKF